MVKGITTGLMLSMHNFGGGKKLEINKVFAGISVTVGGDGKSITRNQLQTFIKKVEMGVNEVKISQKQFKAYKLLDSSWETLFGDKDAITAQDFEKAIGIFTDLIINNEEDENVEFIEELKEKAKKRLEELSEKINGDKDKKPTVEQLKEYLSELISKNEDNKNDEEIALVTNLIAETQNPSENEYTV